MKIKAEGWLFLGCGMFFGGSDIVYWYLSKDPPGTTAFVLAFACPSANSPASSPASARPS